MKSSMAQKEEQKEILQWIRKGIIALKDPDRLVIVSLLWAQKSLFFSEIKAYLKKENPSSSVPYHIKFLEHFGIISNKKLEPPNFNTRTGKARTSIYQLTEKGKHIYETLLKMINFNEHN